MKKWFRVLCLFLCLAFCFQCVCAPKAHAVSELLIVGMIALTMGVCVAITMIAADSAGMTGAIKAAAESGLQDTAIFTEQLLRAFWAPQGLSLISLMALYQQGTKILKDGSIALSKDLSDFLSGFFDWSWSADGGNLQDFAPYIGDVTYTFSDNLPEGWGSINCVKTVTFSSGGGHPKLYTYKVNGDGYICYFPNSSSPTKCVIFGPSSFSVDQYIAGTYQKTSEAIHETGGASGSVYDYWQSGYSIDNAKSVLPATETPALNISDLRNIAASIMRGQTPVVDADREQADTNVLDLGDGLGADTNILDIPSQLVLPAPVYGTVSADSYIGAVRDAIYDGTGTLDYTDSDQAAATTTLAMEGVVPVEQVLTGAASLEGAVDVAEGVGSPTMDRFSIDLRDYFPFCVPFDIYDMLHLLSGSREAPKITWQFVIPRIGTYDLEIDFSPFDGVAQVLRTVELLAFAIALGFATKKMLMGS